MQPILALSPKDIDRFWSKVRKTPTCWHWTGPLTQGYGSFHATRGDRRIGHRAHRIAFLLLKGPIDDDLVLDHICRVRDCVNPDHLRAVTNKVNVLAGIGPTAVNARKTHCKRGHEFTDENTFIGKRGYRTCLTCMRSKAECPECGDEFAYTHLARHRRRAHGIRRAA